MTDIKDCCCCGKVYKKPKHKDFSLRSARHQSKCIMRHGFFMLFNSHKKAQFWIDIWSEGTESMRLNDRSGQWKIKALATGYHAVTKETS